MTNKKLGENPYQFILVAGARTNQLLKGAEPRVGGKKRKPTFVALEEAREGKLNVEIEVPRGLDDERDAADANLTEI